MLSCNNPDCLAIDGHVKTCPLSMLPRPNVLASMSSEELEELKEKFEAEFAKGEIMVLEEEELDERFIMAVDLASLPTSQAIDIVSRLFPEFLSKFLDSNEKYKLVGNELGHKGVFPDINRKVGVLKARVWDDEPDTGREPTREIIIDLIGHLFLMLHMYDEAVQDAKDKHPAGKGQTSNEVDDLEDDAQCTQAFGFAEEDVKCFRLLGHEERTHHFGRRKDGSVVQWHRETGALL